MPFGDKVDRSLDRDDLATPDPLRLCMYIDTNREADC